MTKITIRSTRIFAVPNFIRGMARAFDMGSTQNIYNDHPDEKSADSAALYDDWRQVGEDLEKIMENYEHVG